MGALAPFFGPRDVELYKKIQENPVGYNYPRGLLFTYR